jgi:uncharacterized protein (DUF1778 family)
MSTPASRAVSIRVRITPDELEQLREAADADRRTVSQLAWIAIQDYLARRAGKAA